MRRNTGPLSIFENSSQARKSLDRPTDGERSLAGFGRRSLSAPQPYRQRREGRPSGIEGSMGTASNSPASRNGCVAVAHRDDRPLRISLDARRMVRLSG